MATTNPFQPAGWNGREPCTIFISSWSRPIHMWVALDALWRTTRSPARVILLDNHDPDPGKERVIAGFDRRGLFSEIVRFETNTATNIAHGYMERLPTCGRFHVVMDADAAILEGRRCWLEEFTTIMTAHPRIGMLGSLVDVRDFVAASDLPESFTTDAPHDRFLSKLDSPERGFIEDSAWNDPRRPFFLTQPPCPIPNPPGRLLMLDTESMLRFGRRTDGLLADCFREHGMTPAVTARVRHRHLSLLNIFDYDDYSVEQRGRYFYGPR